MSEPKDDDPGQYDTVALYSVPGKNGYPDLPRTYVLSAKGHVVSWTTDIDQVEGWLLDPLNSAVALRPVVLMGSVYAVDHVTLGPDGELEATP